MPVIMCEYCEYIGRGETYKKQWDDVLKHEETCPQKDEDD